MAKSGENLSDRDLILKVIESQERLEQKVDGLLEKQEKLWLFVFGNGQPGLSGQVRDLEKKFAFVQRLAWIIIGLAIPAVLSFLWLLLNNRAEILIK